MVAEKTSKLQGCPFFKSHRGAIPCIVCENEISNQRVLSKAKSATRTNMENLCIGRRLLRVCDVFKFLRNWLLIGKRISIIQTF